MLTFRLLFALCIGASATWVCAQDYPSKPVRLIVPLVPGAGVDITARNIATGLTESFRQTVVVDNRAGGGGSIGAELVAHATPDGYTLIMVSGGYLIYPLMYPARYDAVRDFSPVTQATSLPLLLVSSVTLPVKSVSELIALARDKPGAINYATSGRGSFQHLTSELFRISTGTDLLHVPYKGTAAAYPDLIAGRVQLLFAAIASAMPHISSGRLRGLAVSTRARSKSAPDFPSLHEAGVQGFDVTQWYGVLAPARTPRHIVDLLQRRIAATIQQPEFIAQLAVEGSDPVANSPGQFGDYIRTEIAKWGKVIKQAGIRGE